MQKSVESQNPHEADDTAALLEQLQTEHRELEARLEQLDNHLALSVEEQAERARLKKLKLAKKDQIQNLTKRVRA